MTDDGLVVNFAIGDEPLKPKSVFKGGKWKDRLQAKKSLQRGRQKYQTNGELTGSNAVPTKEHRIAGDEKDETIIEPPAKRPRLHTHTPQTSRSKDDYVSSLFTSNPTARSSRPEDETKGEGDKATIPPPSNAPLPIEVSNFTSLGLSSELSAHLLRCLSVTAPTAIQETAVKRLLQEDGDAFIQAETGSGKTLAYLLPLIERLMHLDVVPDATSPPEATPTSKPRSCLNRTSGLFVLILVPTRELSYQLSSVLTNLLSSSLPGLRHIVAGSVTGGATKNHEKARIRKGLNILVATPGRLVDHLENTKALNLARVKWLVLDEGDRLIELGFEDDIRKIVRALENAKTKDQSGRDKKSKEEQPEEKTEMMAIEKVIGLPDRRRTILCSATMKTGVQRLGEISLRDAIHISAATTDERRRDENTSRVMESSTAAEDSNKSPEEDGLPSSGTPSRSADHTSNSEGKKPILSTFSAPSQLQQSYIIVPPKQRLVTVAALLRRMFARRGSTMKAIMFLSCADSVDFHFEVFGRGDIVDNDEKGTSSLSGSTNRQVNKQDAFNQPKTNGIRSSDMETSPSDHTSNVAEAANPGHSPTSSSLPSNKSFSGDRKGKNRPSDSLAKMALTKTTRSAASLSASLTIYKLHARLPPALRTATLRAFSSSSSPSLLLATDVVSRGLDLPNIDSVIEYDPAFSAEEHLHRVGRTARAGRAGRSVVFLSPGGEEGYVRILESISFKTANNSSASKIKGDTAEEVLKRGFDRSLASLPSTFQTSSPPAATPAPDHRSPKWDAQATTWQLDIERWILSSPSAAELARKAYISHVRAYATHIASEREMFDVKDLHLGHLAKGFGLRERPGKFGRAGCGSSSRSGPGARGGGSGRAKRQKGEGSAPGVVDADGDDGAVSEHRTAKGGIGKRVRARVAGGVGGRAVDDATVSDGMDAARKMRVKMREQMASGAAAAEFNIG